jgi:predicted cupin superfamily sugar epimerase
MSQPKVRTAAQWVEYLHLQPHPEGGFFRETYRAPEGVALDHLPSRFGMGDQLRQFSTAIYYLLETGQFSSLHRIQSDEVWHFYAGSCLEVYSISPTGELTLLKLGNDPAAGEVFQGVVSEGSWFGAMLGSTGLDNDAPGNYALVGCTVAPGFDFNDFELGTRADLLAQFPQHAAVIRKLTRLG